MSRTAPCAGRTVRQADLASIPLARDRETSNCRSPVQGHRFQSRCRLVHQVVSVLPASASLKALRQVARRDPGARPLVGFGDPVFGSRNAAHGPASPLPAITANSGRGQASTGRASPEAVPWRAAHRARHHALEPASSRRAVGPSRISDASARTHVTVRKSCKFRNEIMYTRNQWVIVCECYLQKLS
jgi:hypothetical protein